MNSIDEKKITDFIKDKIRENILQESKKKIRKRFFISDTHLNDSRLNLYSRDLLFTNKDEVNDYIVKRWNEVVGKDDEIYHIGDVSMDKEGLEIIKKLNGYKILIKGNYDISSENGGTAKYEINDKILLKYFDEVYDELEIEIGGEKVYLNHFPTNMKSENFNIVGHIHGTWKVMRNAINVGVDAWHFVPVSEDLIKFQMNGIRNHYDQNVFSGELLANVKNKKGEIKVLRATEEYKCVDSDENKSIFVFLAGPIEGTNSEKMWQEEFITEIQKGIKDIKTTKNIIICSPRRLEKPKNFVYEEQVNWESKYLELAGNQGIIVFWFAKETEKIQGRSFARTSRVEYGEWIGKSQLIKKINMIVGYENGFDGFEYIEKKFTNTYPGNQIKTSKKDMIDEIIEKIKKMI